MTSIEISTYILRGIVVKNKDSKTIMSLTNGKKITGLLLQINQIDINKARESNIWSFEKLDGSIVEINGNEINSLKTT